MARRERKSRIAVGMACCLLLGLALLWWIDQESRSKVVWGESEWTVSERDHFYNGLLDLHQHWIRRDDLIDANWTRTNPPHFETQVLAIDLDRRQLWLERQGRPIPGLRLELPARYTWTLYHSQGGTIRKLPTFTVLRDNGQHRQRNGIIALVGQEGAARHIAWWLWGHYSDNDTLVAGNGSYHPETSLQPPSWMGQRENSEDTSPLVRDEALLQQLAQRGPRDTDPIFAATGYARHLERLPWRQLQAPLYREVEQQLNSVGLRPTRIMSLAGPDFTAGVVGVSLQRPAAPDGLLARLLSGLGWRRYSSSRPPAPDYFALAVDRIAPRAWHCRTTSGVGQLSYRLKLDFDVHLPEAKTSYGDSADVISHRPGAPKIPPPGELKYNLPLGTQSRLEIVGLCRKPGSRWWAPDGSFLDYWPGFIGWPNRAFSHRFSRHIWPGLNDRWPAGRRYERTCFLVLRVPSTVGFRDRMGQSSAGQVRLLFGKSPVVDRFGLRQEPGQYLIVYLDPASDEETTHCEFGFHVLEDPRGRPTVLAPASKNSVTGGPMLAEGSQSPNSQMPPWEWIRFENLALEPGQHMDFRLVALEKVADPNSKLRIKVRP